MTPLDILEQLLKENNTDVFNPSKPLRHNGANIYASHGRGITMRQGEDGLLWPSILMMRLPGTTQQLLPVRIGRNIFDALKEKAYKVMQAFPFLEPTDFALKGAIMRIDGDRLALTECNISIEPAWKPSPVIGSDSDIGIRIHGELIKSTPSVIRCFADAGHNVIWAYNRSLNGPISADGQSKEQYVDVIDLYDRIARDPFSMSTYKGMPEATLNGRLLMLASMFDEWANERKERTFRPEETIMAALKAIRTSVRNNDQIERIDAI